MRTVPDWTFLDEYEPLDLAEQVKKYDGRTQEVIAASVTAHVADILRDVDGCESPIEVMLGIAINARARYLRWRFWSQLNPQYSVSVPGGDYRVDFAVALVEHATDNGVGVYVECDGHDFHEKTKEQAARDKKRDRDLSTDGTPVLHFTGSEIWRNAEACAREVIARLESLWEHRYGGR